VQVLSNLSRARAGQGQELLVTNGFTLVPTTSASGAVGEKTSFQLAYKVYVE